jgi:hypothetical protein
VRTGAVRLYLALLIAEREGVLVAEQYGFGHLFKAAASCFNRSLRVMRWEFCMVVAPWGYVAGV